MKTSRKSEDGNNLNVVSHFSKRGRIDKRSILRRTNRFAEHSNEEKDYSDCAASSIDKYLRHSPAFSLKADMTEMLGAIAKENFRHRQGLTADLRESCL